MWMQKHPALRTRFVISSHGIFQLVQTNVAAPIEIETKATDYCQRVLSEGFDTNSPVWFRVGLIQDQDQITKFVLTMHHTLYDGWSMGLLMSSLFQIYEGIDIESTPSLRKVIEYIEWKDLNENQSFWNHYLEGIEPDSGFGNVNSLLESDRSGRRCDL